MSLERRRKTGPLTEFQELLLAGMVAGKRQKQIAVENGKSVQYASEETCLAAMKMGVSTSQAAVARYATYLAYDTAADLIQAEADHALVESEVDQHVAHVLYDLATLLRERGERLLPQ